MKITLDSDDPTVQEFLLNYPADKMTGPAKMLADTIRLQLTEEPIGIGAVIRMTDEVGNKTYLTRTFDKNLRWFHETLTWYTWQEVIDESIAIEVVSHGIDIPDYSR